MASAIASDQEGQQSKQKEREKKGSSHIVIITKSYQIVNGSLIEIVNDEAFMRS